MIEYEQRNIILKQMGFETYDAYLQSPLWKRLRKRALRQARGKCKVCGDDASEIHHTSYDEKVLQGKTIEPLVALCRACHDTGEHTTSGRKTTLAECNRRLGLDGPQESPKKAIRSASYDLCTLCRERKAKHVFKGRGRGLCRKCKRKIRPKHRVR